MTARDRADPAGVVGLARQQPDRLRGVQLRPERQRHVQPIHRPDSDYGVDVLNSRRPAFINARTRASRSSLEVATFAPHAPYTPAPRNANDFPGLTATAGPVVRRQATSTRRRGSASAPRARRRTQSRAIDASFRKRAQAVESVDKLARRHRGHAARAEHLASNTYIVFSSDNGYHLGQHRLPRGQADRVRHRHPRAADRRRPRRARTAASSRRWRRTSTCTRRSCKLGGGAPATPIDGRSLVPLLHPPTTPPRVAHRRAGRAPRTHDAARPRLRDGGWRATRPSYEAIRISAPHLPGLHGPGRRRLRRVRISLTRSSTTTSRGPVRDRQRGSTAHAYAEGRAAPDSRWPRELSRCDPLLGGIAAGRRARPRPLPRMAAMAEQLPDGLSILMPVYNEIERSRAGSRWTLARRSPVPVRARRSSTTARPTGRSTILRSRELSRQRPRHLPHERTRGRARRCAPRSPTRGELLRDLRRRPRVRPGRSRAFSSRSRDGRAYVVFGVRTFDGYTSHSFLYVIGTGV